MPKKKRRENRYPQGRPGISKYAAKLARWESTETRVLVEIETLSALVLLPGQLCGTICYTNHVKGFAFVQPDGAITREENAYLTESSCSNFLQLQRGTKVVFYLHEGSVSLLATAVETVE